MAESVVSWIHFITRIHYQTTPLVGWWCLVLGTFVDCINNYNEACWLWQILRLVGKTAFGLAYLAVSSEALFFVKHTYSKKMEPHMMSILRIADNGNQQSEQTNHMRTCVMPVLCWAKGAVSWQAFWINPENGPIPMHNTICHCVSTFLSSCFYNVQVKENCHAIIIFNQFCIHDR